MQKKKKKTLKQSYHPLQIHKCKFALKVHTGMKTVITLYMLGITMNE